MPINSIHTNSPTVQHGDYFNWLFKQAAPFWWRVAFSILLGCLTIGSSMALMASSAYVIASAALQPSIADLQVAIVGVRFFGIARGVFRYLERYVSHDLTFRILARLRVWFYSRLEPLVPARLLQYHSGDLLTRAVADIETLQHFYVRVIAPPITALLITAILTLILSSVYLPLGLIVLLFLAVAGVGIPMFTGCLGRNVSPAAIESRAALNIAFVDAMQGSADLLAFGQADAQEAKLKLFNHDLSRVQRRIHWLNSLDAPLAGFFAATAVVSVLIIAIPLVSTGALNGVSLSVLALAVMASFEAVMGLPTAIQYLRSSLTAAQRLNESVAVSLPLQTGEIKTRPSSFDLHVRGLSFRYTPEEPMVLDNLSFDLSQGESVAIVGPSGAGKSTLVNLLLRFWDYEIGEIQLGEIAICNVDADLLRSQIAVVSQTTYLFNTTIRENLLIAKRDATEAELIHAAQQAQIHDLIRSLPQGYDTWVGEHGLKLSSGQQQRLAIARALLKDAPMLILDEPTTNLDAATEQSILETLRQILPTKTTLLITHSPSVAAITTRQLRIEHGHVCN